MSKALEPFKFVEVTKEITGHDLEALHGNVLNIFGYTPYFFITGTCTVFINGHPCMPGTEWREIVPDTHPIEKRYEIVFGNEYGETASINGMVLKNGPWFQVYWKEKFLN